MIHFCYCLIPTLFLSYEYLICINILLQICRLINHITTTWILTHGSIYIDYSSSYSRNGNLAIIYSLGDFGTYNTSICILQPIERGFRSLCYIIVQILLWVSIFAIIIINTVFFISR